VARRDPSKPNALLAAAKRVNLREPGKLKGQIVKAQDWHEEVWSYFDEIGEVKEPIRYRGNQLAKLRLYVAVKNPNDPEGDPIPVTDEASGIPVAVAQAAEDELGRLRSTMGGQGEILRQLDMNWELIGDCYLVGYGERPEVRDLRTKEITQEAQAENWMIHSISEVEVKGSGRLARTFIKADENDNKGRPLDPEQDTVIRLWLRHPRWANKADCTMRSLLGDCRILQNLTQQLLAHGYRALSAGILTVPNELSFGPPDPARPEESDTDKLNAQLDEVLSAVVEDPTHPATVQPAPLRGPGEFLKPEYVRILKFYDPEVVRDIETKIEARVMRIARGHSLPVERVLGSMNTTFANAKQIDQDEYDDYFRPSANQALDALTYAFLRPQLTENPSVGTQYAEVMFIAADPSDLFAEPDTEANANAAHDRFTISDAAYRRAKGFSEDTAPEPEEVLLRMALRRGLVNGDLTAALLELVGLPIDLPEPEPTPELPPGSPPPDEEPPDDNASALQVLSELLSSRGNGHRSLRAASRPAVDYGRRLNDLDRDLRSRLIVASNAAMGNALDRAANRLRTRTNGGPHRSTLQAGMRRQWYSLLGPSIVADLLDGEDPLSGAWDGLESEFRSWGGAAQAEALRLAGQATGRDYGDLRLIQAEDLDTAWLWLAGALTQLANERMWDPSPSSPEVGEFDPSLTVPAGVLRQAIARAGGATGLVSGGSDAWVILADGGTRPAGGIGTGEVVRGALRDGGAGVEGYVWEYGPAFRARPFEPHMRLDGKSFPNFDSPILAGGGWTGFSYWIPGDHSGCLCDARPELIIPD
jgi:hypothetical protein